MKHLATLTNILVAENNRTISELKKQLAERDRTIARLSAPVSDAELTRIKDGGGWYEDTPAGVRKFYTVSEEQEVKTATEKVNALIQQLSERDATIARLSAPVSDEEWHNVMNDQYHGYRESFNRQVIAARVQGEKESV